MAVGFRARKANGTYRYFWLYRVKFAVPSTNLTTKGYTAGALAVQDLANGRINAVIIDKQPALMIAESVNK